MATNRYTLVNEVTEKIMEQSKLKFNSDKRLLLLSEGHELELRLVNFQDAMSLRTDPWVTKFIHSVYTKEADDSFTAHFTLCPSTHYLGIANWKNRCLCCKEADELYQYLNTKSFTSNSRAAVLKAAKTVKRKFKMFLPVYVISDNLKPENNNTLKLLMFNDIKLLFRISNYFEKFLRADDKTKYLKHFNNFGNINCFNLIVNVDPENVFEIKFKFAPASQILINNFDDPTVSTPFMEKMVGDLNFDTDFVDQFDDDKHAEFFSTFIKPVLSRIQQIKERISAEEQNNQREETPSTLPDEVHDPVDFQEPQEPANQAMPLPAINIPKEIFEQSTKTKTIVNEKVKQLPLPIIGKITETYTPPPEEASVLTPEMLDIINSIEDSTRE